MGVIKKWTKEAENRRRATDRYGSDVGSKFSSENYAADESKILAQENEGKRMFSGKGAYAKAGKDDRFTMDENTSVGRGVASGESNVAGLFANKRQKLFS